jgi:hypothetical protein
MITYKFRKFGAPSSSKLIFYSALDNIEWFRCSIKWWENISQGEWHYCAAIDFHTAIPPAKKVTEIA